MKSIAFLVVALACRSLDAAKLKVLSLGAPAPAAAAPAPALEALHINFEIKNFNYYDLTKETCPKKVKFFKKKKAGKQLNSRPASKAGPMSPLDHLDEMGTIKAQPMAAHGKDFDENVKDFDKRVEKQDEEVEEAVGEVHSNSKNIGKQVESGWNRERAQRPPWMEDKKKQDLGLLQLDLGACAPMKDLAETKSTKCSTVMDVLRTAIEETVRGIIACMHARGVVAGPAGAPGPAPMYAVEPQGSSSGSTLAAAPAGAMGLIPLPPSAAFLQSRSPAPAFAMAPGSAPASAAAPGPQDVKIFVTFAPGRDMVGGRSTLVEIAFLDRPGNGIDDVAFVRPLVDQAIGEGLFKKQLKKSLHQVTGMKPKLHGIGMAMKAIEQWPVQQCESHIKALVGQFGLHYTRNQVPMALYNECTNFMTRMSFSHDYVLDPQDTLRCRRATANFASHWEHGENAKDSDFANMCHKACEAKYGRNAPKCNLAHGDTLLNQPM